MLLVHRTNIPPQFLAGAAEQSIARPMSQLGGRFGAASLPFYGLAGPNPQRWDHWFCSRQRPQRPDIGLAKKIGAGSRPHDVVEASLSRLHLPLRNVDILKHLFTVSPGRFMLQLRNMSKKGPPPG